jgi:hypothetical protein
MDHSNQAGRNIYVCGNQGLVRASLGRSGVLLSPRVFCEVGEAPLPLVTRARVALAGLFACHTIICIAELSIEPRLMIGS